MEERKGILVILFLVPLFMFMASGEEEHKPHLMEFVGKTINFLILFGGLAYLLRKPLRNFLEKRSQDIRRSLEETEQVRREAEKRLEEVRVRLAGLEKEMASIRDEAEAEGRREKEKTLELGRREAEKVKSFARQEIELLFRAGVRELRKYAADLATAVVEQRIRKKMRPDIQSRFIDKSIERIDKIHEKSDSGSEIHSRAD